LRRIYFEMIGMPRWWRLFSLQNQIILIVPSLRPAWPSEAAKKCEGASPEHVHRRLVGVALEMNDAGLCAGERCRASPDRAGGFQISGWPAVGSHGSRSSRFAPIFV
jgi:hypothetical protein